MDIILENINKKFQDNYIFKNKNYRFKDKKVNFILGPSGTGKTTLIRILMGLESMENGKIKGIENMKISVVFQEDVFCEEMSCFNNIKMISKNINLKKVKKYFEIMGIKDYMYRPVKELSGGMKRRLSIIRSMIYNGDIFIMDEPFKGLDEDTKKKTIDFFIENTREKTIIIVTHDSDEVEYIMKIRDCDIFHI